MSSNIDATKPVAGNPTTQSVRDNFSAAKIEIEALQTGKADAGHTHSLSSLSNVQVSTPSNEDTLKYSNGNWVNAPVGYQNTFLLMGA